MIFHQPDLTIQPTHAQPRTEDRCAVFEKGRILLCHEGDTPKLPTFAQFQPDFPPFELLRTPKAGIFSPHPYQPAAIAEKGALRYEPIGIFRSLPYEDAALIASCWHLWNWYACNRYCGRCGAPTQPDEAERALRCPNCGHMIFPMIAPAVIVAITCGDRILLARNAHSTFAHYALIAGYVEVGETLEQAVRRETLEEMGIRLQSLRYLGDQPWGISGSHMFAFHATADDSQPLRIQRSELSDARWFDRSKLPKRQHTVSIAFELIERFRLGRL